MGTVRVRKLSLARPGQIGRLAAALLLIGTISTPCLAQAEQQAEQCLDSAWKSPDEGIQDCTKAINTNLLTGYLLVHSLDSRGWAYRRKGDYDDAIQDYDRAIQLKPDYAEAFNGRGLAFYGKKEYDRAIQDYTQAIRTKPDYAEAFDNRGLACAAASEGSCDSSKAIADFDEAIKLNPYFAEAFFNRGKAFASGGQFKGAIPDFSKAIELQPDYPNAFAARGDAYFNKNDLGRALEDLNQAIKLNPQDADAVFERSSIYLQQGDRDRAIADLSTVIRLTPNEVWPYWFRSLDYYDEGDYDQAIWDLNRVVEAQPEINVQTVSYIHQRGLAYLYKGDYARAIADFEQVGKIFPQDVHREGLAHFYMGDFRAAEKDFDHGGQFIYSNLWAYLAARRVGENGANKLQRINKENLLAYWPGPVVHFYLGSVNASELLDAARKDDLEDKNPCMCTDPNSFAARNKYRTHQSESAAYFYIGEQELLSGHRMAARALFEKSVAIGTRNTDEYQGALIELQRVKIVKPSKPAEK